MDSSLTELPILTYIYKYISNARDFRLYFVYNRIDTSHTLAIVVVITKSQIIALAHTFIIK